MADQQKKQRGISLSMLRKTAAGLMAAAVVGTVPINHDALADIHQSANITSQGKQAQAPVRHVDLQLAAHSSANAPYLFLGDTDHSDTSIHAYMAKESTMQTLSASGIKTLFIERPSSFNILFDQLRYDVISRDSFVSKMGKVFVSLWQHSEGELKESNGYLADMIQNGKKYGIAVMGADPESEEKNSLFTPTSPVLKQYHAKLVTAINKEFEANPDLKKLSFEEQKKWGIAFGKTFSQKLTEKERDDISSAFLNERLQNDDKLAAYIKDKANGQKAAIFYGVQHGLQTGPQSLIDNLGGNVTKVALLGKENKVSSKEWSQWGLLRVDKTSKIAAGNATKHGYLAPHM